MGRFFSREKSCSRVVPSSQKKWEIWEIVAEVLFSALSMAPHHVTTGPLDHRTTKPPNKRNVLGTKPPHYVILALPMHITPTCYAGLLQ